MFAVRAPNSLQDAMTGLAEGLEGLDMGAARILAPDLVDERDRILRSIRDYLIPRLTDPGRPMTVVIAGPTGAGKSTILNSLAGLDLAETGALRPTTKIPLVATTARHKVRFRNLCGISCHVTTARTPLLSRMALIDTPDIDSTSVEHRAMAERLIDSADVVVFVTSALRYSDLVPWEVLRRAVGRGAPVITVLNRLTSTSAGAVTDYQARLARAGIGSEVVRVPEQRAAPGATRVPSLAVKELGRQLHALAAELDGGRLAGRAVAAIALGDASRLAESLAGLSRLVQRHLERLEAVVAEGRGALRLEGSLDGLTAPTWGGPLRRILRRLWRQSAEEELARWLDQVSARLASVVEQQLLATAFEVEGLLSSAPRGVTIEPALVTMATAIHGWLAYIRRITEGVGWWRRCEATAILILRSLGGGDEGTAERVLGPGHRGLSDGARADLESRIAVAFSQVTMVASALLEGTTGADPVAEIEEPVALATARLTFADA